MVSIDEARRILARATAELEEVEVRLDEALHRALARPVRADRDFPPADRSAMDGFAVRSHDVGAERVLCIAGEVRAGQSPAGVTLGAGEAVRVFTGASIPGGADAVVMVEHVTEDRAAGTVRVHGVVEAGQHVRHRASDRRAGDLVLAAGTSIGAAEIAALASVGCIRVPVRRAPRVCLLSTGDEIIEPDREPAAHQVRNSNGAMLRAQLRELHVPGDDLGHAGDVAGELSAKLRRGLAGDLLVVTGGVSVGEYDLVGPALAEAGMELLFHKVAMKPGKPILAGRRGRCLVLGLPGNPVSAFTGFVLFVAPAIRRMLGHRRSEPPLVQARLTHALRARPGRVTYHLARVTYAAGAHHAARVESTGSGDVLSLARANGFLVTPESGGEFPADALLPALVWGGAVPPDA